MHDGLVMRLTLAWESMTRRGGRGPRPRAVNEIVVEGHPRHVLSMLLSVTPSTHCTPVSVHALDLAWKPDQH